MPREIDKGVSKVFPADDPRLPRVRALLDFLSARLAHAPWRKLA